MNLFAALLFSLLLRVDPPPAPPTTQEIKQDIDAQKYADAIRKVGIALPVATREKADDLKAQLFELRGEADLRLKSWAAASESFSLAGKSATSPAVKNVDGATALLVKRATLGKYTPRQPGPGGEKLEPIDIVEPPARKAAFKALFTDDEKFVKGKLDALNKSSALPPLMDGIKQVSDLRSLELAATGKDEASGQIVAGLSDHANTLMADALKKMAADVENVWHNANQSYSEQSNRGDVGDTVTHKHGLTSIDRKTLQDVIGDTAKIGQACDAFADAAGGSAAAFKGTKTTADALAKRANDVLTANYDDVSGYNNNNGPTVSHPGGIVGGGVVGGSGTISGTGTIAMPRTPATPRN